MYGQTLDKRNKAEAGWGRWPGLGDATHRTEQRGIQNPIRKRDQASIRHSPAIQQVQQRILIGIFSLYERDSRLEVIRYVGKSQERINRARVINSNRSRPTTKQSKLVWSRMVSAGRHNWVRSKRAKLAARGLCKVGPKTGWNQAQTSIKGNQGSSL